MAVSRRAGNGSKSGEPRECCLPNKTDLRFPPLSEKLIPRNATVFKTKIHQDMIERMLDGQLPTIMFDGKDCESGILTFDDGDYMLKAQPPPDKSGGNPMDVMFMVNDNQIRLTGHIYKQLDLDRTKLSPGARRRRTSPPQSTQKKRSVQSLDEANGTGGKSGTISGTAKRQRVSVSTRKSHPVSSLNGIGASSPYPSPYVSPGQTGTGLRSTKSRSITPPSAPLPTPSAARLGRHRTPSSASSPGSPGGPPSAQRQEELRKGIIHILALGEMSESNLKKRLLNSRESPHSDAIFRKLLKEAAKYHKSGYVLHEDGWQEVTENSMLYSEADKKKVRDILARRKKKISIGSNGIRSSRNNGSADALIIVSDGVSDSIISMALEQFERLVQRVGPIRSAKEEQEVHLFWDAWHELYQQVNDRLENMRSEMEKLGMQYDNASSSRSRDEAEKQIRDFHQKSIGRHQEYCKYLPILHKELKALLGHMRAYADSEDPAS